MQDVMIFDLDGTLADHRHRLHFVQSDPKDYDSFYQACSGDKLNKAVYELYYRLTSGGRFADDVIICSGRSDVCLTMTEAWLKDHGIVYRNLMMRRVGDHRLDYIIKREMLEVIRDGWRLTPVFAIDDSPAVVQMWRDHGVPCFQTDDHSWYAPKPGQTDALDWLEYMTTQHGKGSMFAACAAELRKARLL